jgi:hypothetical protein
MFFCLETKEPKVQDLNSRLNLLQNSKIPETRFAQTAGIF